MSTQNNTNTVSVPFTVTLIGESELYQYAITVYDDAVHKLNTAGEGDGSRSYRFAVEAAYKHASSILDDAINAHLCE